MHDAKGRPLQVGDIILVPFEITDTFASDEFCNVSARTVASMYPGAHKTGCTFNAKQVLRANDGDDNASWTAHADAETGAVTIN